jgi:2-succinyl-5-enolpyruvyl-6-hydroxy-3-cyclohexene-1-carboxylate synthase
MMLHDRMGLGYLAELMLRRGIRNLVISPGSRNAPIIETFCKNKNFSCITIVDERSAAFFALGMAQQTRQPVAIACTSGTAPLNYAPAIAEAYYQRIPLLVLTADRPVEYIDQGDGQTIRQHGLYANYIKQSFQFPQSIKTADDLWYANRLTSEALNACLYPVAGPVHINLPFAEPLYGVAHYEAPEPKDFGVLQINHVLSGEAVSQLQEEWASYNKKLIIAGQMHPNLDLDIVLQGLAVNPSVAILAETTSNLNGLENIAWIDRCLAAMPENDELYQPDLLITFGGAVISRRIKAWLKKSKVKAHWHVDTADLNMDSYQRLTRSIPVESFQFFRQMRSNLATGTGEYSSIWKILSEKAGKAHQQIVSQCPYSDLKIFERIINCIPAGYDIQLGNSTPIRYAQLFEYRNTHRFFSNRGVSGIDGCLSTAAGAAFASQNPTLCITGDLAFFYDSNALWNKHFPKNLKIILINNGGGGIFRFLEGPDKSGLLEEFFEARHQTSAEHIVKAFGLDYFAAFDEDSLAHQLKSFFGQENTPALLEVHSPPEESAKILRNYFNRLGHAGG